MNTGKSTIFKQISNEIGNKSYTKDEKLFYKKIIQHNILLSMFHLDVYFNENLLNYKDEKLSNDLIKLEEMIKKENYYNIEKNFENFLPVSKRFFNESLVKENLNSKFFDIVFLKNGFNKFQSTTYLPSNEDVLYTKSNIKNSKNFEFLFSEKNIKLFDVNGGKGERKKWIHIFDEVNILIFVTSISSIFENDIESSSNSLLEDLNLFDGIVNSKFFVDTKIVLLFTGIDLFQEKLQNFNLNQIFENFNSKDPFRASEFLKLKFLQKIEEYDQKRIKSFFLNSFQNAHVNLIMRSILTNFEKTNQEIFDFRNYYFNNNLKKINLNDQLSDVNIFCQH